MTAAAPVPPPPGRGASGPAAFRRTPRPCAGLARLDRWSPLIPSPSPWYGADPAWRLPFERDAKRRHGGDIVSDLDREVGRLTYRASLEVRGLLVSVPVTVSFFADPRYETYNLPAQDYPRVWADAPTQSPHRMSDLAMCLYYPWDPPERRWTAAHGLLTLLNLTRDHLFFELYWRASGGRRGGVWLAPEAPHGDPRRRTA